VKKALAILGAVVCLVFAAAAILAFNEAPAKATVLLVLSAAGLVAVFVIDSRREKAEKRAREERDAARLRELASSATTSSFELTVNGSSQAVLALGLTGVGVFLIAMGAVQENMIIVLGAAVLLFGLLMLPMTWPTIGKAKIVLTAAGFKTPLTPLIPWTRVTGISLQEVKYRGRVVSHSLFFRIPTLRELVPQLGFGYRLLYPFRGTRGKEQLAVALKKPSETPEVVYGTARLLWTRSTGLDATWDPEAESFKRMRKLFGKRGINVVSWILVALYVGYQFYRGWTR
jgi:hypothetical protein